MVGSRRQYRYRLRELGNRGFRHAADCRHEVGVGARRGIGRQNRVGYRCRIDDEGLIFNGNSLMLGHGIDETTPGLDSLVVEVLRLVSDFAIEGLSTRDEDEFTMIKIE